VLLGGHAVPAGRIGDRLICRPGSRRLGTAATVQRRQSTPRPEQSKSKKTTSHRRPFRKPLET